MAVAVAEAQATITAKILLGSGRSLYIGTLAFGKEYATGGDTLAAATESRYPLPEKIDAALIVGAGGYDIVLTAGKVKVFNPGKEKEAQIEVASKADLSAVTAAQFLLIGPS